MNEIVLK